MAKFQHGHKLAKGGRREGAGRPTKAVVSAKKVAAEVARGIVEASVEKLTRRYIRRAIGPKADKVLMHAMDKILPAAKAQPAEISVSGKVEHHIKSVDGFDWEKYAVILGSVSHVAENARTNGIPKSLHSAQSNGKAGGFPEPAAS